MKYQINLTSPLTVGTYPNQRSVSAVRLASVAINFQHAYFTAGVASAALLLEDCAAGNQVLNPQWNGDAETLTLITNALAATNPATGNTFEQDVLARAQALKDASGNPLVPPGTIVAATES